jgi:broad specificity phosphatase PhoE
MLELILARHGQSYGNLDRSLGPDTDLTDLGREQAAHLGDWLVAEGYEFTAFYCSTLRRARQTAEIVNLHHGLDIVFDRDLREAEQLYLDVLPQRPDPLSEEPAAPFSREYEVMRERVVRATRRILAENHEGRVLVVAHGGTLGTMLRSIFGGHAMLVRTDQTALHCLRWQEGRWSLQFVNRREHLVALA